MGWHRMLVISLLMGVATLPTKNLIIVMLALSLLCGGSIRAGDTDATGASLAVPSEKTQALLSELGASHYQARYSAFLQLWENGKASLEAVGQAKESEQIQVAQSAAILEALIRLEVQPSDELDVALVFQLLAEPTPVSVFELCRRKHWALAEELLKTNPDLVRKFREPNGVFQVTRIAEVAYSQGEPEVAWPILVRVMDLRIASWLAAKNSLSLPVVQTPAEQAVVDFYSGKVEQALKSSASAYDKIPWIARAARWDLLASPENLQEMQSGVSPLVGRATEAVLQELAGNFRASEQVWSELYTELAAMPAGQGNNSPPVPAETPANPADSSTTEIQSGVELLRQSGSDLPIAMFALLASGQIPAVEAYLVETDPAHAFVFQAANFHFGEAFEQVGLESDLSNFDAWLESRRQLILEDGDQQAYEAFSETSRLCENLLSLGFAEQAEQLLDMLVDTIVEKAEPLRRTMRSNLESRLWGHLGTSLSRDEGRLMLLAKVRQHYAELSSTVRPRVLASLYPELDSCAELLLNSAPGQTAAEIANQIPTASDSKWEALEHLWQLDVEYFGEEADSVVAAWLKRAMDNASAQRSADDQAQQMVSLALDFGLPDTALQLAISPESGTGAHWAKAAEILVRKGRPGIAHQYLAALRGYRIQEYLPQEIETLILAGDFDEAEKLDSYRWFSPLTLSYQGDASSAYDKVARHLSDEEDYRAALPYAQAAAVLAAPYQRSVFFDAASLANCLTELDEHLQSADARRAATVELLHPSSPIRGMLAANSSNLYDYTRYMAIALHRERLSRAIGLIRNGDYSAAMHEAQMGIDMAPMDIEMAVECVPLLRAAGRVDEADIIFSRLEATMLAHLEKWPNDATSLNNLAWMYAKCDAKLDAALELSQKATALSPVSAVFLDTLAEVQYHRGDSELAIESMRGCIKLDPRDSHYRENLLRFRSNQP